MPRRSTPASMTSPPAATAPGWPWWTSRSAAVTIDVRGEDGDDPVLDVLLPDGTTEHNDDRGPDGPDSGNTFDPYLEFDVDEGGTMVIMITGWADSAVDGEVTLEID